MQLRKYGPPACAGACKEGARGSRLRSASYGGQAAPHARRSRALQLGWVRAVRRDAGGPYSQDAHAQSIPQSLARFR